MVAELEHRIGAVLPEVEVPPRLEPRPVRQRLRRDVDRIPAVVVKHDELRRTANEEALACGGDVRLEPWLPSLPVLRQATKDLAHAAKLRRALHVDADGDEHRPTLTHIRHEPVFRNDGDEVSGRFAFVRVGATNPVKERG